jgi:hypothetical protein
MSNLVLRIRRIFEEFPQFAPCMKHARLDRIDRTVGQSGRLGIGEAEIEDQDHRQLLRGRQQVEAAPDPVFGLEIRVADRFQFVGVFPWP